MTGRSSRSRSSQPNDSFESNQSPRRFRSESRRRKNFSGLDLNPDTNDDEEYEENIKLHDDEEEEEDEDEDDDENNLPLDDIENSEDSGDDSDEVNKSNKNSTRDKSSNPAKRRRQSNSENELDPNVSVNTSANRSRKKIKHARGRKPPQALADDDGNPFDIANDEVVLDNDPDGETKIDEDGNLKDGREYRVRTFTVKGKGNRLYMLSTEPARCMGFRDSYLLFQKHRYLYKLVIDNEEKYDLIDRRLIPHSYKGRSISLVTARSIFREFGAKIIVGGRKVVDDYYESKAKEHGDVEGDLADPLDNIPGTGTIYNKNQYVAWHGASQVYNSTSQSATPSVNQPVDKLPFVQNGKLNDENWMYQHAFHARAYDTQLFLNRQELLSKGLKDSYTGLKFYPVATQPKKTIFTKIGKSSKLIFDTVVTNRDLGFKSTGLKNVPLEIFESVDEDIKQKILKQQQLEKEAETI